MQPKLKLIDHLLVLGIDFDKQKITAKSIKENSVNPTMLEIYPPTEKGVGLPRFLENCNLWGFENGFKLYDQNLNMIYGRDDRYKPKPTPIEKKAKGIESKNKMYSFVMTDEHYCKRYCTSLLFHEPYFIQSDDNNNSNNNSKISDDTSFVSKNSDLSASLRLSNPLISDNELIYVPKSISVVSSRPCFETQRMILKYIFGDLLGEKGKDYCDKRIRIPTRHLWNLGCFMKDIEENKLSVEETNIESQTEKILEYDRETYLKGLGKEEEIFVHESQLREFYFSAVFSLLEIPPKPMDKVVLKLHDEDDSNELVRYRVPKKNGLYLPETNYKMLLRRLSPKNIVKVFKYILMEKQIIFFSQRTEEIPYVTEAFLSLISPLSWCCLYVPFLPISMWEILHAVMPYIVGVSSRYKEFVANQIDLTDKIVVDLDDDALFIGEDTGELPKEVLNYLVKELDPICTKSRKADPKKSRDLWVELTLKTRQIFNVALLAVVNNYLAFFNQSRDKKTTNKNTASEVFFSQKYLAQFPPSDQPFMKEFAASMVFINLIEESYRLIYSDRNGGVKFQDPENVEEIATFIEQLKALTAFSYTNTSIHHANGTYLFLLHKKAVEYMGIVNYDSTVDARDRYHKPEYIDLFPYLIKYYFKFILSQSDRFKLLSSPMSFKSSNPASKKKGSPERWSDFINREIQYFNPLNKSKIVDLKKIFSIPPKPKPPQRQNSSTLLSRNSDPPKTTASTTLDSNSVAKDHQGNAVNTLSKPRNSQFGEHHYKRFSLDSPMAGPISEKIDVNIDYKQLSQLRSFDETSSYLGRQQLKPSRYSAPDDYETQSYDIPRQNSGPIRITKDLFSDGLTPVYKLGSHSHPHHKQSMPSTISEIPDSSPLNFSKAEDKVNQIRWDIPELGVEEPKRIFSSRMRRGKDEEEQKLYTSLHIPRKGSDTNYRILGRAGTEDSSVRVSLNDLDRTIPRDNRPLGKKNMVQENGVLANNGQIGGTGNGFSKAKPVEGQARKKIFDEKETFIPTYEEIWDKAAEVERGTMDQVFVGKVDYKGKK